MVLMELMVQEETGIGPLLMQALINRGQVRVLGMHLIIEWVVVMTNGVVMAQLNGCMYSFLKLMSYLILP